MSLTTDLLSTLLPLGYLLALVIPFTVLRLYAFREELRFSPPKTALLALGLLLFCVGSRVAIAQLLPESPLYLTIHGWVILILFTAFYFYLTQIPIFQQVFVHILLLLFFDLLAACGRYVEKWLLPETGVLYPYLLQIATILVLVIVTFPLVRRFLEHTLLPLMLGVKTNAWRALWLLPACLFCITAPALGLLDSVYENPILIPLRLLAFSTAFILISTVLKALEGVADDAMIQENGRMVLQLLASQEEQVRVLENCIADVKSARQDYKLNIIHIKTLFSQHAYSKLSSFLTYGASNYIDSDISYCDIPLIDSLVRYYRRTAEKKSIRLTVRLSLPRGLPELENDLSILLSNCMANALEACERSDAERRFIEIRARKTGPHIAIVAENSYSNYTILPQTERRRFYASDRRFEEEEIGVMCIRSITQRYNGTVKFDTPGGGIQRTSITLQLPTPPPAEDEEETAAAAPGTTPNPVPPPPLRDGTMVSPLIDSPPANPL